jgi:Domain of unknown function (DUF4124)/WXXGXW repeat (2 copies)
VLVSASLAQPTWMLRAGEVYKSVDAQGHVVYSDQPDMSVAQTRVEIAAPNLYFDDGVRVTEAPPPLPDYEPPPCPEDGTLWTPGYWAWNDGGYFWVRGAWVPPPRAGVLWTPGYWEYLDTAYVFHRGYWAPYVGYYGGINYGFGYFGSGFAGGRWVGNSFAYNKSAYAHSAHVQVSYHGGPGGTSLAATAQERALALEPHTSPTPLQRRNLVQAVNLPRPLPQGPMRVTRPGPAVDRSAVAALPRSVSVPAARASAAPKRPITHTAPTRMSVPTRF